MKPQEKAFIVVGTSAVLIAAGLGGAFLYSGCSDDLRAKIASTPQDSTSTTSTVSSTPSTSSTPVSTSTLTSGYKDGTYTASASYDVPHGATNSTSVKVTLSGGEDTDVSVNDDLF